MMKPYPELQTDRLILREFAVEDATSVQRLASEWKEPVSRCSSPTPTRTGNGRGVAPFNITPYLRVKLVERPFHEGHS
jgi:hypothetical protein